MAHNETETSLGRTLKILSPDAAVLARDAAIDEHTIESYYEGRCLPGLEDFGKLVCALGLSVEQFERIVAVVEEYDLKEEDRGAFVELLRADENREVTDERRVYVSLLVILEKTGLLTRQVNSLALVLGSVRHLEEAVDAVLEEGILQDELNALCMHASDPGVDSFVKAVAKGRIERLGQRVGELVQDLRQLAVLLRIHIAKDGQDEVDRAVGS